MKSRKCMAMIVLIATVFFVSSCGVNSSASDKDQTKGNSTQADEVNASDEYTITRKAPNDMNELRIADTTRITNCWTEPEVEIEDQSQIEKIKDIVAKLEINDDTHMPTKDGQPIEGGTWIRFYSGEDELFQLNIVGSDDIGKCMITSDDYCFFCDISESDVKEIRSAWQ